MRIAPEELPGAIALLNSFPLPTRGIKHSSLQRVPSSQDFEGLMLLSLLPLHLTHRVGSCGSPTHFFRCSVCTAGSQKASTPPTFSSNSERA